MKSGNYCFIHFNARLFWCGSVDICIWCTWEESLKKLMQLYALMSCWTLVIGLVSNLRAYTCRLRAYTCRFDTILDWKVPFNGNWFNPVPQLMTFLDSSRCLMWVFSWRCNVECCFTGTYSVSQRSSDLSLEVQSAADPDQTSTCDFLMVLKTLISMLRSVWLNSAGVGLAYPFHWLGCRKEATVHVTAIVFIPL